ncbi:hypothetical protein Pcinc_042529 [Petrolisthes cinctipes]|uniref:Uncharacterized protein n=1 Tax=Petrolisthes cinctipes TaxID=88211 RepID=A0AAE1BHI8_PETCI|nr:hypothetical protein Pcinc_042529 [Petrolisthes cinctipes]
MTAFRIVDTNSPHVRKILNDMEKFQPVGHSILNKTSIIKIMSCEDPQYDNELETMINAYQPNPHINQLNTITQSTSLITCFRLTLGDMADSQVS